jgi:hypothetical protein
MQKIHFLRETFPAIDPDMDCEGKPGLYAGTHEAEQWIYPVMINMKALSRPRSQYEFFAFVISKNLVTYAWLNAAQHTNQTIANTISLRNLLREGQLLGLA